jgi:hypothetical protein
MNVCVVITVATVMLLRDFAPYGIIFIIVCVYYLIFPSFLTGNLPVFIIKSKQTKFGKCLPQFGSEYWYILLSI